MVIEMVARVACEARSFLDVVRNPAKRLDPVAARSTVDSYDRAQLNATSTGVSNWGEICTCASTPELDVIMKSATQAVQEQSGVDLPNTGLTAEGLAAKGCVRGSPSYQMRRCETSKRCYKRMEGRSESDYRTPGTQISSNSEYSV